MAPVKKDLMHVIVDVSPTMHGDLPAIGHSLASLFHKLLLFEKPGKVVASIYMSGSNGRCTPPSALRAASLLHRRHGQRARRRRARPVPAPAGASAEPRRAAFAA